MKKSFYGILFALALCAFRQDTARADEAIVVGVMSYPTLRFSAKLGGCVNDANAMQALLEKDGFHVTSLTETKATKTGIMNAIATVRQKIKPNERFVFFFAGHGTKLPVAAVLPYDVCGQESTVAEYTASLIKRSELKPALEAINARSKIAIIDACFSGGMRGESDGCLERSYLRDDTPEEKTGAPSAGADFWGDEGATNAAPVATAPKPGSLVVVAAALPNQKSYEKKMPDGESHGLFTQNLVNAVQKSKAGGETRLAKVLPRIKTEVGLSSGRRQMPTTTSDLPPAQTVFGTKSTAIITPVVTKTSGEEVVKPSGGETVKPSGGKVVQPSSSETMNGEQAESLWDQFLDDRESSSLRGSLFDFRTKNPLTGSIFAPKDEVSLQLKSATPGFVVLLNLDDAGQLKIVFPTRTETGERKRKAVPSFAETGDAKGVLMLSWRFKKTGTEYIKAVVFNTAEEAADFVTQFDALADPETGYISQKAAQAAKSVDALVEYRSITMTYQVEAKGATP